MSGFHERAGKRGQGIERPIIPRASIVKNLVDGSLRINVKKLLDKARIFRVMVSCPPGSLLISRLVTRFSLRSRESLRWEGLQRPLSMTDDLRYAFTNDFILGFRSATGQDGKPFGEERVSRDAGRIASRGLVNG